MLSFSDVQLEEVADIIGSEDFDEEAIESRVAALVQDPMLARRLIDWVPEAFRGRSDFSYGQGCASLDF